MADTPTQSPSALSSASEELPYSPLSYGRPRLQILDELTVLIESNGVNRKGDVTNQRLYKCSGKGCSKEYQPRSKDRVLMHAKNCLKLIPEHRHLASQHSAEKAPGAVAAKIELLASSSPMSAAVLNSSNTNTPTPIFAGRVQFNFGPQGRKALHAAIDLAVVKYICVSRTPPLAVDLPEWKGIFAIQTPSYHPASRTTLMDNHIMSEQEHVRGLNINFLKNQERVSISFDGGTLRSGASVYTVHATPEGGDPILLIGRDATGFSHTGPYIASVVEEVSIFS